MKCCVKHCPNHEHEGSGQILLWLQDTLSKIWICNPCFHYIKEYGHKPREPNKETQESIKEVEQSESVDDMFDRIFGDSK